MFTALLIIILIVAGAATVVGGGLVLTARKRNALGGGPSTKQLGSGTGHLIERSFEDLRVNDIVVYNGQDFLVEGVIRYDEAGHSWSMARIVDVREAHWLLVGLERSGGSSKKLLSRNDKVPMDAYPPEVLIVEEKRYTFDKRGTATASLDGDTGSLGGGGDGASAHRCRWWSYNAAGSDALLVEQWGDDYRVLQGKALSDSELEMMPGS